MSFTGDLEHLPVVDIIQLLHSSKKSGTLVLMGPNGESKLVFCDGYIVGANHRNTAVRLGQVLLGMKAITQDDLDAALATQSNSGTERQPLIATLIESGKIDKNLAYKGLENLIVMTIIDILTWDGGTFTVDVEDITVSDEYRYFPETLQQDFYASTQNILMDALRIYDEKMRDGELTGHIFAAEPLEEGQPEELHPAATETVEAAPAGSPGISAELLGLDELEHLKKKIPDVFRGLRADTTVQTRKTVGEELPDLPADDQEKIIARLQQLADSPSPRKGSSSQAVLFFSKDELFKYAITMLCKHCGYFAFTTDDPSSLDMIIEQTITRESTPIFLIDAPVRDDDRFGAPTLRELRQEKLSKYPGLTIIQMVSTQDTTFAFESLRNGVSAIFPKPVREIRSDFAEQTFACLDTLHIWLEKTASGPDRIRFQQFIAALNELDTLTEPAEVAFALLRYVASIFERAQTFVVTRTDLIAERGIGIKNDKEAGFSPPLKFKIPLQEAPLFRNVVDSGHLHWGSVNEPVLTRYLSPEIPPPAQNRILLLPIKAGERTIALIYGDFGNKSYGRGHVDLIATLTRHASAILENSLYRKGQTKNV